MDTDGFFRNLEEKQSKILSCLDRYFETAVTNEHQKQKDEALLALADIAGVVAGQIAAADQPAWLSQLVSIGRRRRQHADHDGVWQECFRKIKQLEPEIRNHSWTQQESDADPIIDFDSIVSKHRNKEEVERLFGELIQALEKLVACEELDSRRVIVDLERLIATLHRSRTGSFHFQLLSAEVAKQYVKNLMASWLRNTKAAKIMIEAANETIDELGMTMEEARAKIQDEVSGIERAMIERLSQSAPPQLGHDSTPVDDYGDSQQSPRVGLKPDSGRPVGTKPRLPLKDKEDAS